MAQRIRGVTQTLLNSLYTSADVYQGLIRTVCPEGPQIPY